MQDNNKARRNLNEYPDAMTIEDLCEFLNIGRNAAYKLIQAKEIASIRIGRLYRIPKQCVYEYLNKAYNDGSANDTVAYAQREV